MTRGMRAALGFLTILPAGSKDLEIAAGIPFFPIVGVLVGGLSGLLAWLLVPHIGSLAGVTLALLAQVVLTRNLHWDGVFDTIDGLVAYPREKSLAAMRDSRVGGGAAVAGGILILLFVGLGARVPFRELWLVFAVAGMAGRGAVSAALGLYPYARPDGLGLAFAGKAQSGLLVGGLALALLIALLGLRGVVSAAGTVVLVVLGGRYAVLRFGGLTGDVYGAIEVLTEILVLASTAWR